MFHAATTPAVVYYGAGVAKALDLAARADNEETRLDAEAFADELAEALGDAIATVEHLKACFQLPAAE